MKNKKRRIAFVMAVIMLVTMIPFSVLGADDQVVYNINKPDVGIMNKTNSANESFRKAYLRSTDENFNLVYKFNRTGAKNVKGADGKLSYDTSMIHYENGEMWHAYYGWTYQQRKEITVNGYKFTVNEPTSGNKGVGELFAGREIEAELSADLTADLHRNYFRHDAKILDRACASLEHKDERGDYSFITITNERDAPDESPVYTSRTSKIDSSGFLSMQLHFCQLGCECGSAKVSKVSLGLIDKTEPTIRSIYASRDENGKNKEANGFKAGDTGYLNLQFSENIRFAKDEIPKEPVMLTLIINGAENNLEIKTAEVQARLVRLEADRMVFKFTVPQIIANKPANVYISGISDNQSWVNNIGGAKSFPLSLLGKNGYKVTLTGNCATDEELTYTSSLVTDMAGNPISWQRSTKSLSEFCFLDNVPPVVSSVEIKGARISKDSNQTSQAEDWPKDIDRSTVFAGIGDTLTFSVIFNEVMELPKNAGKPRVGDVAAVLNAKDGSDTITIMGKSIETVDNGVNGIKVSRITFEPLKITKEMVPDGTGKPFKIEELSFPTGTVDLRKNVMVNLKNSEAPGSIPAPRQQQYLDTQLPAAETGINSVDGKYTPVFYTEGDRKKEFYFPVTVNDVDTLGNGSYKSGSNGVQGSFAWLDEDAGGEYPFDYYVSASSSKPDNSRYMGAITSSDENKLNTVPFTQVETGSYIHIRLRDDVKYNMSDSSIIVMGGDFAQNKGYDEFILDYAADLVPPVITRTGEKNSFDSSTNEGTMEVTVSLKDPSGINPSDVEYQWVAKDAEAEESAWAEFSGVPEELTAVSLKIKIENANLENERTHEYDLLIRAADKRGNISEAPARIQCIYDLEKANPNLEIKDGFDIPTKDIVIGMELDMYSGSDSNLEGLPAVSVLMIKNPEGEEDEYFVNIISARDGWLGIEEHPFNADDLFEDRSNQYTNWYSARVIENQDRSFSLQDSMELGYYDSSDERKLLNKIINHEDVFSGGGYYGDLELIFVTAYGETPVFRTAWEASGRKDKIALDFKQYGGFDKNTAFHLDSADGVYLEKYSSYLYGPDPEKCFYYRYTEDAEAINTTASAIVGKNCEIVDVELPITRMEGNLNVQKYTLMLAPERVDYDKIGLEFGKAVQADGTEGLMWNEENYEPGGTPKYLKNLDGAKIPFTLKNPRVPHWGVSEMDFESEYTYAALYYSEHGPDSYYGQFVYRDGKPLDFSDGGKYTYVYEITPLIKTKIMATDKEQEFIIPYGITDKTGFYTLEISVKPLNSNSVKKFYYTGMYADGSKAVGNGLERYDISVFEEDDYVHSIYKYLGEEDDKNNIILGTGVQEEYHKDITIGLDIEHVDSKQLVYRKKIEGETGESIEFIYPDSSRGYIKVWNAINTFEGKAPDYAQWQEAYEDVKLRPVENTGEITDANYTDAEGNPCIPVLKDGSSIICYQIVRSNGSMSPIMQVNITTSSQVPEFDLKLDSDGSEGRVNSVTAFAENVTSLNGAKNFNIYGGEFKAEENMASVTIGYNGEYYFYVEDNANNVSIAKQKIDWIDGTAPEVSSDSITSGTPGNEFHIKVTMEDNSDMSDGRLFITFDKDYSSLLNRKKDEEGSGDEDSRDKFVSLEVPLAENGAGEWTASESAENQAGIYKTKASMSGDKLTKTVEIWGAFKYDGSAPENEPSTVTMTFVGSDQAGNMSQAYETETVEGEDGEWYEAISEDRVEGTYVTVNTKNIKPEFSHGSLTKDDKVKLDFTAPVLVTSPDNSNPVYGRSTDSAAIYSDGERSVSYRDLFGSEYKEDINLVVFGKFNAAVKFSETEPTQNDVDVFVEIPQGSDAVITGMKSGALSGEVSTDKKSASIAMTANGNIVLSMEGAGGEKKDRNIAVSNIDRLIEDVVPHWYFAEGEPSPGEPADGPVTVGLYCQELLTGTNGPLTYTFTNGAKAGDTHTFEYEDMAKNKGSYTAALIHDVVYTLEDTSPPEYSVAVYSKLDYTNKQGNSYQGDGIDDAENRSFEDAVKALPKAQGYMLMFNVFDESKVRLIVKNSTGTTPGYTDTSDTTDGVTVSDRVITIEKNAEFNIYLADEKGNTTGPLAMKFDKVDTSRPTATVEYAASTFYSTIGYLVPDEDITITNVSGVEKASGGTYDGRYFHKYEQNEDFVFYYKDEVGNTGYTKASVDWLDVNPPEIISLKWTPVGAGQKEENGIYPPPAKAVNRDVIAQVEFNKTVQEVKAYNKGTETEADSSKVAVEFIQNGAVVTYRENADVDLYFKSYNGKHTRLGIGSVACIDKTKPVITDSSALASDKQSEEYVFTSDKDVYMAESKAPDKAAKKFTYTFTANGTYDMHFTDKAGNSIVYTVKVMELDKEKMKVYFNTAESDDGASESAARLDMDGKTEFYVKLSKNGTVTYDGASKPAAKDNWIKFNFIPVPDKFFYMVEAVDGGVGTRVFNYIGIEPPDKVPPAIILPSPVISLREGSTAADITAKLSAGVLVSDNKDSGLTASIKTVATEAGAPVQITDNMNLGRYRVEYTASDNAGNTASVYRTLRIYGKDMINAMINGAAAEPDGTMVLNTQEIVLNIENLPGSNGVTEPCRVSYKAGIMTAGQMKIRAVKVETDRFTLPGTGFYTIYIQAQDRRDYITYVYIEK